MVCWMVRVPLLGMTMVCCTRCAGNGSGDQHQFDRGGLEEPSAPAPPHPSRVCSISGRCRHVDGDLHWQFDAFFAAHVQAIWLEGCSHPDSAVHDLDWRALLHWMHLVQQRATSVASVGVGLPYLPRLLWFIASGMSVCCFTCHLCVCHSFYVPGCLPATICLPACSSVEVSGYMFVRVPMAFCTPTLKPSTRLSIFPQNVTCLRGAPHAFLG
jgi:hypothetical protein